MINNIAKIDALIGNITNHLISVSRISNKYGTDVEIFSAEIHLLEAIHDNPDYNVSKLSQFTGSAKSVVSKTASKLEKKGLIRKLKAVSNNKEVYYILTSKGRLAYEGHNAFHAEHCHDDWTHISQLPEKDQQLIINFLENYIDYLVQTKDEQK
ncbi:MarR family transcriptional regulator [Clostridiaceae bacterium M8S5]|nr:MarR family transcriptional regulator [Clostridiaceae bacterium M8S5]